MYSLRLQEEKNPSLCFPDSWTCILLQVALHWRPGGCLAPAAENIQGDVEGSIIHTKKKS